MSGGLNFRFEVSLREKSKEVQAILVDVVKKEDGFKVFSVCPAYW